ncbi:hypothetical protein HPB52_021612 [Rhipicephalus sanguineus]|uniref:Uncharacterized protein n=1 Tax=Rhipicephalus sanguineus TaxID=34632 RepID=A0A9D4QC29_RHISA|nr:hypothetical protein HPB52_021612 [Rhipicephalus sanguineus]
MQFAAQLGQEEPLDVPTNDCTSYEERLTFLIVNMAPEHTAFRNHWWPRSYLEAKASGYQKTLGDHLPPKPSAISDRSNFNRRDQLQGELISYYVADLQKLAQASARLEPTQLKLRTYTGALVIPKGVLQVKVQHGGARRAFLYTTLKEGPPLPDREWIHSLRPEWSEIWNVQHLPSLAVASKIESVYLSYGRCGVEVDPSSFLLRRARRRLSRLVPAVTVDQRRPDEPLNVVACNPFAIELGKYLHLCKCAHTPRMTPSPGVAIKIRCCTDLQKTLRLGIEQLAKLRLAISWYFLRLATHQFLLDRNRPW